MSETTITPVPSTTPDSMFCIIKTATIIYEQDVTAADLLKILNQGGAEYGLADLDRLNGEALGWAAGDGLDANNSGSRFELTHEWLESHGSMEGSSIYVEWLG